MEQKDKIMEVLKKCEGAIGWTVVKIEILKWIDARIIYLISNSPWVSPTRGSKKVSHDKYKEETFHAFTIHFRSSNI
ncbi:unnamed protein product [Spirodela intermedia]|uniref:Uncharacterized protein n=1 Tax=Spirodela intermedia TaxID=51605 RepID=A0A7I8KSP9_SPIIN|nr:unnamed protein product [Spirodela intermedia]